MLSRIAWMILLLLFFCSVSFAQSKVDGSVTVQGKKLVIRHVYALQETDQLTLLFTESPVSEEILQEQKSRISAGKEGKIQGIELHLFDDESVTPDVQIYHSALKGAAWIAGPVVKITQRSEKRIEGTLLTEKPGEFFGKMYQYKIQFVAELP